MFPITKKFPAGQIPASHLKGGWEDACMVENRDVGRRQGRAHPQERLSICYSKSGDMLRIHSECLFQGMSRF